MLTDGTEPGQCSAFDGDAGQLGVHLAHAIRVSHLSVGYGESDNAGEQKLRET